VNKETTHLTKESLKLGTNKDEKPTHLDLFSGIGGFALAAGWAGFETIGFCDNEPYAQAVLKKHWPNVPIHGDIKTLDGTAYRGVTLLTGGFPCQPYSSSGKQRGKDDDRHLWPEMLRVIQQAKPSWVIGENVVGIINMELEQVCIDLEACGYEVEPIIIPACGVDTPHRRNRVWIIGGGGMAMWPTPCASEMRDCGNKWTTLARLWKGERIQRFMAYHRLKETLQTSKATLNPSWVEWLMGYPIGHTDLKDWVTPSSRKSHTKSSKA